MTVTRGPSARPRRLPAAGLCLLLCLALCGCGTTASERAELASAYDAAAVAAETVADLYRADRISRDDLAMLLAVFHTLGAALNECEAALDDLAAAEGDHQAACRARYEAARRVADAALREIRIHLAEAAGKDRRNGKEAHR